MPEEFKPGCQHPPTVKPTSSDEMLATPIVKEAKKPMIKVGKAAPEFTAPAFFKGKFTKVSLADFKGKWVILCFYPGDFTFV